MRDQSRGRGTLRNFFRKKSHDNDIQDDRQANKNRKSNDAAAFGASPYEPMKDNLPANDSIRSNQAYMKDDDSVEVYIVRQQYGYCSILFSLAQTIVLALMMWQCGIAPLKLNPMIGPYPDALSEWGGKNSVLILEDGEVWRLVTPIMLHAGVLHLLGNIAVQLETGVFFEKEWGSWRWLVIYLGSGIGSSILSVIAMPLAVSVGSSGGTYQYVNECRTLATCTILT